MENIFKEKFDSFESQPSAGLFNAIQAKRKRKKRVIWIWSAASILILGTAFFSLNNRLFNSTESPVDTTVETPVLTEQSDNVQFLNEPNLSSDELQPNNSIDESNEIRTIVQESDIVSPSHSNTQFIDVILPKENNADVVKNSGIINHQLAEIFKQIVRNDKNTDINKAKFYVKDKEHIVDARTNEKVTQVTEKEANSSSDKIAIEINEPKPQPTDKPVNQDKQHNLDTDNDFAKLSKWSIDITAGPGYAYRTFSDNNQYTELRDKSDKGRISSLIDLRSTYRINPYWNVQGGLNYIQRNESFASKRSTMVINTSTQIQKVKIIHPILGEIWQDVEVMVLDTTWINGPTINSNNSYNSINLPIAIERVFYVGSKFTIMAKAGIQFGIHQAQSGTTLNANFEMINLNDMPYKKSGINRVELGIGAGYKLSNRVMIMIYPQANITLKPSLEISSVKQRDFGIYSQFGLRINL